MYETYKETEKHDLHMVGGRCVGEADNTNCLWEWPDVGFNS